MPPPGLILLLLLLLLKDSSKLVLAAGRRTGCGAPAAKARLEKVLKWLPREEVISMVGANPLAIRGRLRKTSRLNHCRLSFKINILVKSTGNRLYFAYLPRCWGACNSVIQSASASNQKKGFFEQELYQVVDTAVMITVML